MRQWLAGSRCEWDIAFFFVPITGLSLSAVQPQETASAAGLASFMRTTAGAFATSLITTRWDSTSTFMKSQMAGMLHGTDDFLSGLANLGFAANQATSQLDQLVIGQATMVSTDRMFLFSSVALFCGAGLIWHVPRPRGPISTASH